MSSEISYQAKRYLFRLSLRRVKVVFRLDLLIGTRCALQKLGTSAN